MKKITTRLLCLIFDLLPLISAKALNDRILVGYWHNFKNGAANGLKLSEVSDVWDVINLSFAEPTTSTSGILVYNPTADNIYSSANEFKRDVKAAQNKGKKIVLSIGGEKGQVRLETTEARDNFIKTTKEIIKEYNLDGLDIDFEGQSLKFEAGDTDLENPTTPVIKNLIYALKDICKEFGDDFLLTFAPETFFVQQAYSFYGVTCDGCDMRCGAYLPVLYALKDRLSWLQVQYYNSGPITSPEGMQSCGTEDFIVYLVKMLADGFPIKDAGAWQSENQKLSGKVKSFPALPQSKIVIGVPSVTGSAGAGTLATKNYISIMNKLIQLGYKNIRGFMTWSINWDKAYNYEWSQPIRTYINSLNGETDTKPSTPSEGEETSGGQGSGTSVCKDVPQWDSSLAYNVYGEHKDTYVQFNNNLYQFTSNNWQPAGVEPTNTIYGVYWTLIGPCS